MEENQNGLGMEMRASFLEMYHHGGKENLLDDEVVVENLAVFLEIHLYEPLEISFVVKVVSDEEKLKSLNQK